MRPKGAIELFRGQQLEGGGGCFTFRHIQVRSSPFSKQEHYVSALFLAFRCQGCRNRQVYRFLQRPVSCVCQKRHTDSYRYWCTREKNFTSQFCKNNIVHFLHDINEVWVHIAHCSSHTAHCTLHIVLHMVSLVLLCKIETLFSATKICSKT